MHLTMNIPLVFFVMRLIILFVVYLHHLTVSENSQNFVKLYEYQSDTEKFRGVAKNGSTIAFVTENYVITGNLEDDSFRFTELNKILLAPDLIGTTELSEFEFIDENTIIICNEKACCLFPIFVVKNTLGSNCLKTNHSRSDSFHLRNLKIQKGGNGLLFLKTVYDSYYTFIESYNFDSNGILTPKGISSWDQGYKNFQESVYSFYANHIYFIDVVVRNPKSLNETKFYNTDIVITKICNNDDLKTPRELILSCEGIWYNNTEVEIENVAKSALYSSDTNTLLISIWQLTLEKTMICKFDMAEIENGFQKAGSFCRLNSTTLYFIDECDNTNFVNNNCKNYSEISLSVLKTRYENQVIYGKSVYSSSDHDITAIFPSNKNSEEIYALTDNGKLIKVPFGASYLFANTVLNFGTYILYQKFSIIQWKEKAGFIFIDPSTKRSVYFKNATCEVKYKCHETFSSNAITCGKCPAANSSSCDLEMQTICPPLWYNEKNRKKNPFNHRWSEFDGKTGIKIAECFKPSLAEGYNCSGLLKDYLKPLFQVPYIFNDDALNENKFMNFKMFVIIVCLLFAVAVCCSSVIYFYYKNKKLSEKRDHSSKTQLEEFNKRYLISGKNVALLELLGSGFTSDVYLANFTDNSSPFKVAVKTLKIHAKKEDILKEIQLLSLCKHSNIVTFIGWIDQEPYTCIITEFMGGGDLHAYLKNPTNLLLLSTIFSYIFQVLDAMIYLSHKKILHRDLAARNCLLNESFEILKLNDFGLSRKMNFDYQYVSDANPHLPFKWLPLEALEPTTQLHKIFTLKGDIWSLGIVIWEMFERGNEPYDGMDYPALLRFLKRGNRLSQPKNCPLDLYQIMQSCWEKNLENRPSLDEIQNNVIGVFSQIKITTPNLLNHPIEIDNRIVLINENYKF